MTQPPQSHITEAKYLAYERESPAKHEYFAGEIFAMTGVSEQHNLIASNVNASLHTQLRQRPCRVYPSDMRVIDTTLILSSVDCQLHLVDVYEKVKFSSLTSVQFPRDITEA